MHLVKNVEISILEQDRHSSELRARFFSQSNV